MKNTGIRRIASALSIALGAGLGIALAPHASAQQEQAARVIITGSNIPRTEAEGVSPVQTITRDEIERSGVITATDLVNRISSNMSGYSPTQALGDSGKPGFSGASLRGLGGSNTLVLLNGRRIANYAFDSGGVDLNTIPLSAIERVEVLLDGASAIYGTDAIGGVINFITRTDYSGGEAMAFNDSPRQLGGSKQQQALAGGTGNLRSDGFNLFGSIDFQKMQAIRAIDREFAKTSFLPQYGINKTSGNVFPANVQTATGVINPGFATGCFPPVSIPQPNGTCRYDYASRIDIVPPQEKTSAFLSGAFRVSQAMQLFGELNYVHNVTTFAVSEVPASAATTFNGDPLLYPANGPFDPYAGARGNLNIFWRAIPAGRRTDEATSDAARAVVGMKGLVLDWDYNVGLSYNWNKAVDRYTDGWVYESKLLPAMFTGLINPFGPQTAAGQALLDSTKITGVVRDATGRVPTVDARVTKELTRMPAGPLGIALGVEVRQEKFVDDPKSVLASGDVLGGGGNQSHEEGSRNVKALYAELSVPIVRTLEGQMAVRMDRYSDFGSTTNPKVGLKWTPIRELGFRGAYNKGFHAPSLFDLHGPQIRSNTANTHDDPARCPGGVPVNPATQALDCNVQQDSRIGGNTDLQPEKSKQFSLGMIAEPWRAASVTVDYYNIERSNTISTLSDDLVFSDPAKYSALIVRGPGAPGDPAGTPGVIDYIDLRTLNLGKIKTNGLDVSFRAQTPRFAFGTLKFGLQGNRVLKYQYQVEKDGPYSNNLGLFAFVNDGNGSTYRIIPTWRHYATATWELQDWALTLANSYTSSYRDANANQPPSPPQDNKVSAYRLWDLFATFTGEKNLTLIVGVRNLFDRDPPFSNQGQTFQVGFEPKFADPAGRSIFGKLIWKFL